MIREALRIRGLIEKALLAVTPPEWQAKGELHRLVVRMLDAVPEGRADPFRLGWDSGVVDLS